MKSMQRLERERELALSRCDLVCNSFFGSLEFAVFSLAKCYLGYYYASHSIEKLGRQTTSGGSDAKAFQGYPPSLLTLILGASHSRFCVNSQWKISADAHTESIFRDTASADVINHRVSMILRHTGATDSIDNILCWKPTRKFNIVIAKKYWIISAIHSEYNYHNQIIKRFFHKDRKLLSQYHDLTRPSSHSTT